MAILLVGYSRVYEPAAAQNVEVPVVPEARLTGQYISQNRLVFWEFDGKGGVVLPHEDAFIIGRYSLDGENLKITFSWKGAEQVQKGKVVGDSIVGLRTSAVLRVNSDQELVSRAKLFHLACFRMSIDSITEKNLKVGWPGDLANRDASNRVVTASEMLSRFVEEGYIKEDEMQSLTEIAGHPGWSRSRLDAGKDFPFKIYRVRNEDPVEAIVFATSNFTYGNDLDVSKWPYAKGFYIVQKGGAGTFHPPEAVKALSKIGRLPGRKDIADRPVETVSDTLTPE